MGRFENGRRCNTVELSLAYLTRATATKRPDLLPPYTTGSVRIRSNLDMKLGRVIGGWQWRAADRSCASRCGHSSRRASGLGVAFVGALCRRIDSQGVDPRSLNWKISSPGKSGAPRRLAQSPMAQSKTPAGADTAGALAYGLVRRQGKPRCRAKYHAGIQSRRTGFHNSILQVAATPLYSRSLARLLLQTALAPGELRLSWVCVTRAGIIARRHGLLNRGEGSFPEALAQVRAPLLLSP
jgi:hypothetical protein